MQDFRDEQSFPEFTANEVPVEKCVLEHETEREDQFPIKYRVVVAEGKSECDHEKRGNHGGEQPQLEYVPEKRSCGGAAPEKGENERCHAEIGNGAEYRVIGLEQPEMSVRGGSQVARDEILYEKGDSLDKEVYEGDEYADFDIADSLEH